MLEVWKKNRANKLETGKERSCKHHWNISRKSDTSTVHTEADHVTFSGYVIAF